MCYNLNIMNFVTLDFETAKYARESACAIGLVKFEEGRETGSFYSLIRPPDLYIRPDFTDIHGLTVEDVRGAPVFSEIWESVRQFAGDLPIAAHNAGFDMRVLEAVLAWYGLASVRLKYFCTLALSRAAWPGLPSYSLSNLGKHFGITYKAHDALEDARTCGLLACKAAEKLGALDVKGTLKAARVRMRSLKFH